MIALQPRGVALPVDINTQWVSLLAALAEEFSRVDNRISDLVVEFDPAKTTELLADWERVLGLPDQCSADISRTDQDRRNAILLRLSAVGGQSREYFRLIAERFGFKIQIEETYPFYCGTNGCGDPVGGDEWKFHWIVHTASRPSLALIKAFECAFEALKPAHTTVSFGYGETQACVGPFSLNGTWQLNGSVSLGTGWCLLPDNTYGPFQLDGTWQLNGTATLGAGWTS